jgi:hypothetical protein
MGALQNRRSYEFAGKERKKRKSVRLLTGLSYAQGTYFQSEINLDA